jgi:hypothetical protein
MLASLLIATQGLMPSPTPLSIGVQGLLFISVVPPVPINPIDLPGGGGGERLRKDTIVSVRGNKIRITCHAPSIEVSSSFKVEGCRTGVNLSEIGIDCLAMVEAIGTRTHLCSSRVRQRISTSFEIVGCAPDDEAQIMAVVQSALEQQILDEIVNQYSD